VQRIHPGQSNALYSVSATRLIETLAQTGLSPHALMQRAGLTVAKLALAIAPHAQRIWIACGPGNNGGDGLEAAMHLKQWGKEPLVTWLGTPEQASQDTLASFQRAVQAGVNFSKTTPTEADLVIDALLGLGSALREPQDEMARWIQQINLLGAPVIAVDLASGLHANTGTTTQLHVKATHTLSLLTLKPGLFTAQGRDASGMVWFDDLQVEAATVQTAAPSAVLVSQPFQSPRAHASHKGTYGDVAVVGGAPGMTGAALLAATAALHSGAGRVFVALLDSDSQQLDACQPELMFRTIDTLDFHAMTVVCGCGGGTTIHPILHKLVLSQSPVVIDADALNSIATDASLQTLLTCRADHGAVTVLTPHPLEAARLLGCSATQVQQDRLAAADALMQRFKCVIVLKGSGTVIAAPGQIPAINPTGNARLATAGTGDVLAGMVGAKLSADPDAFKAACEAVYLHGQIADQWPNASPLTAFSLATQVS
jgi:hydroxyethylthiazole kinase-like uncharacterized protein yjeF